MLAAAAAAARVLVLAAVSAGDAIGYCNRMQTRVLMDTPRHRPTRVCWRRICERMGRRFSASDMLARNDAASLLTDNGYRRDTRVALNGYRVSSCVALNDS